MYKLYKLVQENGGWRQTVMNTQWDEIQEKLGALSDGEAVRRLYEKYLFQIEYMQKLSWPLQFTNAPTISVQLDKMDPSLVKEIPVTFPPEKGEITDQFWTEVLDEPILILRDFVDKVWNFDHSMFTIESIRNYYGTADIRVLR